MPSEGGNKPGPTIDNPTHASHVPEWKKKVRRLPPVHDLPSTSSTARQHELTDDCWCKPQNQEAHRV